MGRLGVLGDIGGHWRELKHALENLGMEGTKLPSDLVVCQVGDLIHRGPASPAVVSLVDDVMRANPGQWYQVAGNHEAQYLFEPRFAWPEVLDDKTVDTLRRWWDDGLMHLSASFHTQGMVVRRPGGVRQSAGAGDLLITHAGLSAGCWDRLGRPGTSDKARDAINALEKDNSSLVWRAGGMLYGGVDRLAGPVWAEAASEVYDSWRDAGENPGFHQAHGHSNAYHYKTGHWNYPADRWDKTEVKKTVDSAARVERIEVFGQVLWGTDPSHGKDAVAWAPLVLAT